MSAYTRTIHMTVCIEGVLRWPDKDLRNLFRDEHGNKKSGRCVRDWLRLQLHNGKKVLPLGEPCEGFSYETGCPGHAVKKEAA